MQGKQTSSVARVSTWVGLRTMRVGPILAMLAVPLVTLFPGTADAATDRGRVFGGATAQGQPVVIELSRSRLAVKRTLTVINVRCTSGAQETWTDVYTGLKLRRGRFADSFRSSFYDEGVEYQLSGSIRGRITRSDVRGTWTFSVSKRTVSTGETDSCQSGRVSYSARP